MTELKIPNAEELTFKANGVDYFIEKSLSFDRYEMYQKLSIECGYDVSFNGMYEGLMKLFELQNQGKLADAAVLTHNLITGISNIGKRTNPVLAMCALFINKKDEDRDTINDEIISAKIADWKAEHIAMEFFFAIATATMTGFIKACEESTQSSFLMKKLRRVSKSNTSKEPKTELKSDGPN